MAEAQGDEAGREGLEVTGEPEDAAGDLVRDTLAYLGRALVSHPDDVRVETFQGERAPGYRLLVNDEDMGRVIGRHGRVAKSIRTVAKAAAARAGVHVSIEIG